MSETMDTTNILVCDDDKEIAGAIEIYLRNEGYHVFKAYNGVEALRIAREQPLQLIIMDIMMPQMDGVQAVSYTHLRDECGRNRSKKSLNVHAL